MFPPAAALVAVVAFPPAATLVAAAVVAVVTSSSAVEAPAVDDEGGPCVFRSFAHGSYRFRVQQRGRQERERRRVVEFQLSTKVEDWFNLQPTVQSRCHPTSQQNPNTPIDRMRHISFVPQLTSNETLATQKAREILSKSSAYLP